MKFSKTCIVILICVFIVGESNEFYIRDCSSQYINNGYYHQFQGGYYKLHTTPQCWNNARSICDAEGAHLAIINSQSEANFLVNLMNPYSSQYNNGLLIGGQPNGLFGQNCGSMSGSGLLNVVPCSMPSIFACEVTKSTTCENVARIQFLPPMLQCNAFIPAPLPVENICFFC
ncbi:hemolymph lipopolysaccharide-binding protein-like [Chrysoperla carnea]|uniref:hemolymph lipopolysaccharide-binding protein-like n=1 Tax=Chrysoperla carnea TaxID=189513 RepID=UPI001D089A96|nr:hemolymph lipopolysaccharide-binding protein-like [Chrysoperla carnea]